MADIFQVAQPPLPERLTPQVLREAIARTLTSRMKAYDIADECVRLGLPPERQGENPWNSKWGYVEPRLRHRKLAELLVIAEKVTDVYDDQVLKRLLALAGASGVSGEMKNLIFASTGPKPKIVLCDAVNNDLEITENGEHCLVYDRPLGEEGLTWRHLAAWWAGRDDLSEDEERAAGRDLYKRLLKSAANDAERLIFGRYCVRYATHGFGVPALIPQVYLHYDPYTRRAGGTLPRQRMDFLLLLPRRRRVVLELDGIQHYADGGGRADPARYAVMAAAGVTPRGPLWSRTPRPATSSSSQRLRLAPWPACTRHTAPTAGPPTRPLPRAARDPPPRPIKLAKGHSGDSIPWRAIRPDPGLHGRAERNPRSP